MPASVHYTQIYDHADNDEHRVATWVKSVDPEDPSEGIWEQYCGYGRYGIEKDHFRNSMNVSHPLWTKEDYNAAKKNEVYPRGVDSCLSATSPKKRVTFVDTCSTKVKGEEGEGKEMIDPQDRDDRVSRNFANILCDYAEKCGPNEKKVFFQEGGRGMKWVSNDGLMEKIGLRVEEVKILMVDPDYRLNLSDVSVRNFPRRIFESFYERYTEWMDSEDHRSESNLNVGAKVFVPGEQWMPLITRSSPKKICGVYSVEPLPPRGKPWKRRPPSDVTSESQMCWAMKNESDVKLKEIEKKLEFLIGLNGPVVEAKAV